MEKVFSECSSWQFLMIKTFYPEDECFLHHPDTPGHLQGTPCSLSFVPSFMRNVMLPFSTFIVPLGLVMISLMKL